MTRPVLTLVRPLERATLGERLAGLRRDRRLSARVVAARIGRDHSVIVRWECDEREPAVADLVVLARFYRTRVDDLLAGCDVATTRRCSSRAWPPSARQLVGGRLLAARLGAGMSLRAAWVATGIPGRRILAVEAGADPSLRELSRMAAAYRSGVGDLIAGEAAGHSGRAAGTEQDGRHRCAQP